MLYTSIRLFLEKCGYQSGLSKQPVFLFSNPAKIILYSSVTVCLTSSSHKIMSGHFYQNLKLSTFACLPVSCYNKPMEGQGMKHENPETKLIREQNQYIRILEEQLDVCKEQIKAQELLIEKQNQALALFAEAFSGGEEK